MATILEPMGPFRMFVHNVLGWHAPNGWYTIIGPNRISHCKYCNRRIIQDSQGGWFESNPMPVDRPE